MTAKNVVAHDGYRLSEVYISHPSRPLEELYHLSVHAVSDALDLAILVTPDARFYRLAVGEHLEAYMPVYHVESLDVDHPIVLYYARQGIFYRWIIRGWPGSANGPERTGLFGNTTKTPPSRSNPLKSHTNAVQPSHLPLELRRARRDGEDLKGVAAHPLRPSHLLTPTSCSPRPRRSLHLLYISRRAVLPVGRGVLV